jgi:hypothetical protein
MEMDTEMPDFDAIVAALDELEDQAFGLDVDADAVLADELLGEGENL